MYPCAHRGATGCEARPRTCQLPQSALSCAAPGSQSRRLPAPEPALCLVPRTGWHCKGETHPSCQHLPTPLRSCSLKHCGAASGKQQSPNSSGAGSLSSARCCRSGAPRAGPAASPGQRAAAEGRDADSGVRERARSHSSRHGPWFNSGLDSSPPPRARWQERSGRGAGRAQSPAASAAPLPGRAAACGAAHGAARLAPWCQRLTRGADGGNPRSLAAPMPPKHPTKHPVLGKGTRVPRECLTGRDLQSCLLVVI